MQMHGISITESHPGRTLVGGIHHNTGTEDKYLGKTYQYQRYGFLKHRRAVYHWDKIVTTAYHTYGAWKFVGIGF